MKGRGIFEFETKAVLGEGEDSLCEGCKRAYGKNKRVVRREEREGKVSPWGCSFSFSRAWLSSLNSACACSGKEGGRGEWKKGGMEREGARMEGIYFSLYIHDNGLCGAFVVCSSACVCN